MICGVRYKLRHIPNISDDKIISTFNFGFWTELLTSNDKKYITMWRKIFKDVFPNYIIKHSIDTDKKIIANLINNLRNFRNRLFHYEPIFHQADLYTKHQEVLDVLGWINEDMKKFNLLFDEFNNIKRNKRKIQKKLNKFCKPLTKTNNKRYKK